MNSPLDLRPMPQATQPWVGGIFYRAAAKAAMSVAPRLVRMASRPSVQPEPRCDVGVAGDADDRQNADGDDDESRKRALFEAAARSELVDIGRERLDMSGRRSSVAGSSLRQSTKTSSAAPKIAGWAGGRWIGRAGARGPAPSRRARWSSSIEMRENPAWAKPIAMARKRITQAMTSAPP